MRLAPPEQSDPNRSTPLQIRPPIFTPAIDANGQESTQCDLGLGRLPLGADCVCIMCESIGMGGQVDGCGLTVSGNSLKYAQLRGVLW